MNTIAKLGLALAVFSLIPSSTHAQIYDAAIRIDNPGKGAGDEFGYSMAAVGDKLLVSAYRDDTGAKDAGAAYLFDRDGELLTTFFNPDPVEDGQFGWAVSAAGDNILIGARGNSVEGVEGAGMAYLFSASGSLLARIANPSPNATDEFGHAVLCADDRLIISAWRDSEQGDFAGSAYVFDSSGQLQDAIKNPHPGDVNVFGVSLAATLTGFAVGSSNDPETGLAGGTVYTYDANANPESVISNPGKDKQNGFGSLLASDSDKLFVSSYLEQGEAGAVSVFDQNTGSLLMLVPNPSPEEGDWFGRFLGSVGDTHFIVGSPFDNTFGFHSGSAYLYDLKGNLLQQFGDPDPLPSEHFGTSFVAIDGDLYIGNHFDGGLFTGPGAVYKYTLVPELPNHCHAVAALAVLALMRGMGRRRLAQGEARATRRSVG